VNFWPNRIIGDASLPKEQRLTRTNIRKLTKDTKLMESGLLGPVRILTESRPIIGWPGWILADIPRVIRASKRPVLCLLLGLMFSCRMHTVGMFFPALRRLLRVTLGLLVALLGGGLASEPRLRQFDRAMPQLLRVRGGEQGDEAIKALGSRLPEVAAHYRKTEDELRGMLRRDKSLRLDPQARLSYLCEGLVAPVVGDTNMTDSPTALVALADTFRLHSKSNSTKKNLSRF
jgi:hypothetical protein